MPLVAVKDDADQEVKDESPSLIFIGSVELGPKSFETRQRGRVSRRVLLFKFPGKLQLVTNLY